MWIRSPLEEIFTYIYIFISSLWCRGKERRWVPLLNRQCLQISAESGERSVLTLSSLHLPCSVQREANLHKTKYIQLFCSCIFFDKLLSILILPIEYTQSLLLLMSNFIVANASGHIKGSRYSAIWTIRIVIVSRINLIASTVMKRKHISFLTARHYMCTAKSRLRYVKLPLFADIWVLQKLKLRPFMYSYAQNLAKIPRYSKSFS